MGCIIDCICKDCGTEFEIRNGGGFTNYDLHCDKCGKLKIVDFDDLGEIHLRYLKGLDRPYCVATMGRDKFIQENYPGNPIDENEYHRLVEEFAGKCECGGKFTFDAQPRCPNCGSLEYEPGGKDGAGNIMLYD